MTSFVLGPMTRFLGLEILVFGLFLGSILGLVEYFKFCGRVCLVIGQIEIRGGLRRPKVFFGKKLITIGLTFGMSLIDQFFGRL